MHFVVKRSAVLIKVINNDRCTIYSYASLVEIYFSAISAPIPQIRLYFYNHFKNILYLCDVNQFT